ncbi:SDR family NAD(P)-dependent oxidoreductase, partial [Jatrophihabitans endophyticus]|uniref:SDR family NAD(P)-dependent oxidoreductase n=1 Tax=Jatrophihabitans endophyticus TaxID=1206085 RepID=UPI0019DACFF4
MPDDAGTALVVGASRGLGLAVVEELSRRGWQVIGTVRDAHARTPLHDASEHADGRISVEQLDVTEPDQLAPLHERLAGRELGILFVNAGTTNNQDTPIG